jgi:hypothetical protein
MLGLALNHFLKHPVRTTAAVAADPLEAWIKFSDRYIERRERQRPLHRYVAEADWEERLHEYLGVPWPCGARDEFAGLWSSVIELLHRHGIRAGPQSFGGWNDGDAGLVRAVSCVARHLRPSHVVETGVAHGVTSRFILEALDSNRSGHLWSIDLPPLDPVLRARVGIAVDHRCPERWSYISGSSRRRLPALLASLDHIDLFIHDSLHSERNVRFELDRAWPLIPHGGVIIVDDIDANDGFHSFTRDFPGQRSLVCEAEPLHADPRRFNQKGLFGIIVKTA